MITITNTPNLTGVTISGDFSDLYNLVEAFHEIAIDKYSEKHHRYIEISTRVLGLCYDIRHAYQGDRAVELVDNAGQYVDLLNIKYINMTKEKRMKNLSAIAKRIAEFSYDNEHKEIKEVVMEAAKEHQCEPGAIRLQGIDYPEDFDW